MNHPDFAKHDCRTLKKILFGGHAASETFINQLKACFDPVAMVNGGSVSESTALGFALPTEDAIRKITSCGLATPICDIAIFDDDGHEVTTPNVIGEVAYRGQQTNAGYWDEPGKTAEVFRKDGFVLSGDWAKIDEEGYLWLLDRKKDMVVRGGQNVYCIEVENKLFLHPAVLRAAVVGRARPSVQRAAEGGAGAQARPHAHAAAGARALRRAARALRGAGVRGLRRRAAHQCRRQDTEAAAGGLLGRRARRRRWRVWLPSAPASREPLLDRPQLRLDGEALTPRQALAALQAGDALGQRLASAIDRGGIVALTRPDEARFKT